MSRAFGTAACLCGGWVDPAVETTGGTASSTAERSPPRIDHLPCDGGHGSNWGFRGGFASPAPTRPSARTAADPWRGLGSWTGRERRTSFDRGRWAGWARCSTGSRHQHDAPSTRWNDQAPATSPKLRQ